MSQIFRTTFDLVRARTRCDTFSLNRFTSEIGKQKGHQIECLEKVSPNCSIFNTLRVPGYEYQAYVI